MGYFNVGYGFSATLDGVNKICPEEFQIVAVGFLKLGIFVKGPGLGVCRVERPTVAPANMERAFRSVEVRAYRVLFSVVFSEAAVFPHTGEAFEVIDRDLMIRCVAGLFLVVEYGSASDRTTSA